MNEEYMMNCLINREVDRAFKTLAKWYKTFRQLTEEDPEFYAAMEELEKAKANCMFWLKEQQGMVLNAH